jgi:drug/metabolite transporter (DMT)-like permease
LLLLNAFLSTKKQSNAAVYSRSQALFCPQNIRAYQKCYDGGMSAVLIATLAGLVTAVCFGTGDYLAAKSTQKAGFLEINLVVQAIAAAAMLSLLLFVKIHLDNGGQLLRIVIGDTMIATAYLIFLKALSSGVVGIIVPLSNIYPLVTILLSVIFLTTSFSLVQFVAMVIIVLGAAVLAYEKNPRKIPFRKLHVETVLALVAAVIWGAGFFVLNPVVSQVSWETIAVIGEAAAFISALIIILIVRRGKTLRLFTKALSDRTPVAAGLVGVAGMVAVYYGSTRSGSVLIPTVLSAGGPLVASFWAAVLDHERLGRLKRLGTIFVVAGVVILNIA